MMLDAAVIMSASTTDFIKSGRVNWPGVLGIMLVVWSTDSSIFPQST